MLPYIWKNQIYVIFVKKQTINNYRPVLLLPVYGKIFERLIFSSLYKYLEATNYYQPINVAFDQMIHV